MKKLILSSAVALGIVSTMVGQSQVTANIYQEYSDKKDVLSMSLNYPLMDILDIDLDINDQLRHIRGDVYQVKFIAFGDESNPGKSLGMIDRKLASSDLVELRVPEDMDEEEYRLLKFYGVKNGSYYSDICMLMLDDDGETGVFIAVNGKIKIHSAP